MNIDIDAARNFVLGHGRLLDRRRFDLLFEDGDRSIAGGLVLRALLAYQNPDGGFGSALEPDLRSAESQTVCAEVALRMMGELDTIDAAAVRALCDWCAANAVDGGGLPFALPAVASGPRAPWWQATDEPSLNPTAAIVGLLVKFDIDHAWVERAAEWCWSELESNPGAIDHHSALCAIEFLQAAPQDARAERATSSVRDRVVGELVELDPAAEGYVFPPLQFARRPEALSRPWFDDATIDTHLEALESSQSDDGGWSIPWEPPSSGALSEWRAIVTIEALQTLRGYGRL